MLFFQYDARILPDITLIGKDTQTVPHQNIRRISEDYIYYLITKGELFFSEGGIDYHLKAGDCFLFEPGLLHFGTALSEYQLCYIHFRHPNIRRIETPNDASFTPSPGMVTLPKQTHITDMWGFKNLLFSVDRAIERGYLQIENYNILCACAVQEAFLELHQLLTYTKPHGKPRKTLGLLRVREVVTYLNVNYRRRITGEILEKELSYNFDYLNQLFRRYLGTTIFQMLENIRIEAARTLIITSDLPMERIAIEVGYKDETYFSKVFKKHTSLSPNKYRQQNGRAME